MTNITFNPDDLALWLSQRGARDLSDESIRVAIGDDGSEYQETLCNMLISMRDSGQLRAEMLVNPN